MSNGDVPATDDMTPGWLSGDFLPESNPGQVAVEAPATNDSTSWWQSLVNRWNDTGLPAGESVADAYGSAPPPLDKLMNDPSTKAVDSILNKGYKSIGNVTQGLWGWIK